MPHLCRWCDWCRNYDPEFGCLCLKKGIYISGKARVIRCGFFKPRIPIVGYLPSLVNRLLERLGVYA